MHSSLGALTMALIAAAVNAQTWPAASDELEDIMFLNTGYRSRGFGNLVTPCGFSASGPGRTAAAEQLRAAFHDMATYNMFSGAGGLDASLVYELSRSENEGSAFTTTVQNYVPFFGPQASMADLIAMGTYAAVRSCGGPVIPIRYGRLDATKAGDTGIPQPQNAISIFRQQFNRMGFSGDAEMIAIVACGHSLGGVHASSFPQVVTTGSVANDYAFLDSTHDTFDERIASEYVSGNTTNPLVVGVSRQYNRDSDNKVFNADANATITSLADPTNFRNTCRRVLQKMIDTVPKNSPLSANAIAPYEVKPYNLQLYLLDGGNTASFGGEIRVRTTSRAAQAVQIVYRDRSGASCNGCTTTANNIGTANGFDDSFAFYKFSSSVAMSSGISTFVVIIDGQTFDNNGAGFPMQDGVLLQYPQSCLSSPSELRVTAAVRNGVAGVPQLNTIVRTPRTNNILVPFLNTTVSPMSKASTSTVGSYTIYNIVYPISSSKSSTAKFYVNLPGGGTLSSANLRDVSSLATTCANLGADDPNSSTTTTTTITTTITTTATASTTISSSSDSGTSTSATTTTLTTTVPSSTTTMMTTTTTTSRPADTISTTTTTDSQSTSTTNSATSTTATTTDATTTTLSSTQSATTLSTVTTTVTNSESSSSSTTTSASPSSTPPSPGYKYVGCYYDSVQQRTFKAKSTSSNTMDYDTCNSFCGPYDYFGLEYGAECYCASILPANSSSTIAPDSDCNMPCAGNSTQTCGAGNRLSVFEQRQSSGAPSHPPIPGYKFKGCYTDGQSARSLNAYRQDSPLLTNEMCADFCKGYNFFGTEYSAECYCGNTLESTATKVNVGDCDVLCSGNSTQFCGAGDRLSVYEVA